MLMQLMVSRNDDEQVPAVPDPAAASDERELIELSRRDASAVGELYRRHHQAIALYIGRRVGCVHESEDLTAETFMSMVKHLPRYRCRGAPFRSWLYRLATTQVNRWARAKRRIAIKTLHEQHEPPAPGGTGQELAFSAEQIRLTLLTLAPRFQSVIALHYLEGMSVATVATTLGCSEGTVKSRLSRGRDKLRTQLRQWERNND